MFTPVFKPNYSHYKPVANTRGGVGGDNSQSVVFISFQNRLNWARMVSAGMQFVRRAAEVTKLLAHCLCQHFIIPLAVCYLFTSFYITSLPLLCSKLSLRIHLTKFSKFVLYKKGFILFSFHPL